MKAREPRTKVVLRARMRSSEGWSDACIRNISSRGMLIHTSSPPGRGTFVEIRRGRHIVVARVVWTKGRQSGLHTQDTLDVSSIIAEPDLSTISYKNAVAIDPQFERRSPTRPANDCTNAAWRQEQSRHAASRVQFILIGFAGLLAAALIVETLSEAFSRPLATVSRELSVR